MKSVNTACRCVLSGLFLSFAVVQVALAASGSAGKADTVYVGTSPDVWVNYGGGRRSSTLLRELARQALLIAARDELGLETRDAWLGSVMPREGQNEPFQIVYGLAESGSLQIVRGVTAQAPMIYQRWIPTHGDRLNTSYLSLLVEMETASRTDFVRVLKEADFQARVPAPKPNPQPQEIAAQAAFAEQTEKQLAGMDLFSQFVAVRAVHTALHAAGESEPLLGQLVRGYANLGVLTEFHWHPAHKVFKARALLYAQRMVSKYGDASAYEHRAYALALCGLPGAAIESFHYAANGAPQSDHDNRAWVALVKAYCRLDLEEFVKVRDAAGDSQLAQLLQLAMLEQYGSSQDVIAHGLKVIEEVPDCFRVHHAICRLAGVGIAHQSTALAPQRFFEYLETQLPTLPGLPSSVIAAAKLKKGADRGKPGRALQGDPAALDWQLPAQAIVALQAFGELPAAGAVDAGAPAAAGDRAADVAELRWETLGLLLREAAWVPIRRRAYFERSQLGVDGDAWLDATEPVTRLHPYHALMGHYRWQPPAQIAARREVAKLNPEGLEVQAAELGAAIQGLDPAKSNEFVKRAFRNTDETTFELIQLLTWSDADQNKRSAARLLAVAPNSPAAQAILLDRSAEEYGNQASRWQESAGQSAMLALAFGRHFMARQELSRAETMLRSAVDKSHEQAAYLALAELYDRQGDDAKWLSTLQEFLLQPVFGLEHTDTNIRISKRFIRNRDWEAALPFAEAAAQSYSARGLYAAADCHEGLRHWQESEACYRAVAGRYRNERLAWYSFCRRTGYGDVNAARNFALSMVEEMTAANSRDWRLGTFYLLDQQTDMALKFFSTQVGPDEVYASMLAVFLADELQDTKQRDAALRKIVETRRGPNLHLHEVLITLAKVFVDDLAKQGAGNFDIAAVEQLCPINDPTPRCDYHFFLGCYLARCGKLDLAIKQWKRVQANEDIRLFSRILAGIKLAGQAPTDSYPNPLKMIPGAQLSAAAQARLAKNGNRIAGKDPQNTKKLKPPSEKDIKPALEAVQATFSNDYQKAEDAAGLSHLSDQLLIAVMRERDPTKRYVMLSEARRSATSAGQARSITKSIELLDATFAVDRAQLYADAFQDVVSKTWPREKWLETGVAVGQLLEAAIAAEEFPLARQFAEVAQLAAEKAGDDAMVKRLTIHSQELQARQDRFQLFRDAVQTLQKEAGNDTGNDTEKAAAHAVIGAYLAFDRDQWDAARAHWIQVADPDLKQLAEVEGSQPTTAMAQLDLSNQWWKHAQLSQGVARLGGKRRAQWWREQAQSHAKGLTKLRAFSPLVEVAEQDSPNKLNAK